MTGIREGVAIAFYALGGIIVLLNIVLVGRSALHSWLRIEGRHISFVPLFGSVFVLVGLIAAWPSPLLMWIGIGLLAVDPGGVLTLSCVLLLIWWRSPRDK